MRTLLLVLALLSTPALAQTALVVDGPDGFTIEAIDTDLTDAQQAAVDDGRAIVVGRIGEGGWCLGCSADVAEARRDHLARMAEQRVRVERLQSRPARIRDLVETEEAYEVVIEEGGSLGIIEQRMGPAARRVQYEVSLVLAGEVLLDDADLTTLSDDPALERLSITAERESTHIEIRFRLDDEASMAPATDTAIRSLRERATRSAINIDLR